MVYDNYYWGMHFAWWVIWGIVFFWVYATPYNIPGQRKRKDAPLDILQKRFASGHINITEYEERKKILESEGLKPS